MDSKSLPRRKKNNLRGFRLQDQIRVRAMVDAITNVDVWRRCGPLPTYFGHLLFCGVAFAVEIGAHEGLRSRLVGLSLNRR